MSSTFSQTIVEGNIAKDCTLLTSGKQPACFFQVCTTEQWTDHEGNKQERATFHPCAVFGKRAEQVSKMATKGTFVRVVGKNQYSSKKNEDGSYTNKTTIVVYDFGAIRRGGEGPTGKQSSFRTTEDDDAPF